MDTATHEFPMIDERIAWGGKAGYMATGGLGAVNSGLKRIDLETGQTQVFDFGDMTQVGAGVRRQTRRRSRPGLLLVNVSTAVQTSTSRCSTRRRWMPRRASAGAPRPDLVPARGRRRPEPPRVRAI